MKVGKPVFLERLSQLAEDGDEARYAVGLLVAVVALAVFVFTMVRAQAKAASGKKGAPNFSAEDVVAKRFMPTKPEGYDQDQVDELLDRSVQELRRLREENERLRLKQADPRSASVSMSHPIITPEQIMSQKFTQAGLRDGYSQDEVNDFLDKIIGGLRQWTSDNERLRDQLAGNVGS